MLFFSLQIIFIEKIDTAETEAVYKVLIIRENDFVALGPTVS